MSCLNGQVLWSWVSGHRLQLAQVKTSRKMPGRAEMDQTLLDDLLADVEESLQDFKASPCEATLDDVYRATEAITSACRLHLAAIK